MKLSYRFLVLIGIIVATSALPYSKSSGVIELTKDNFANEVFSTEHVWLVEFYAPWCGHCQRLSPEWEKAAQNLKGIVKVAAVNCDEHKELAGYFGIQGFPTIKLFPSKVTPTKDGKGFEKKPEDYNGQRTASAIVNFALSKLPSFVTSVTSKNIDEFLASDMSKSLLFTDKDKTSNLYKALSIDFHHALAVGEIRNTQKELLTRYNVDKFPTLLVIPADGGEPVKYDGKLSHDNLFKFLKPFAKEIKNTKSSSSSAKEEKSTPPPPEPKRDPTEELADQATFDTFCGGVKICIIAFLDPTNEDPEVHRKHLELLKKLSDKHNKMVNVIWMDGIKQTDFVDTFYLNSGFPTAILYNAKKKVIVPYVGAFSEEPFTDFINRISVGFRGAQSVTKVPKVLSGSEGQKSKDEL